MDPESVLSDVDSHVLVITKVDDKWYILDVCEEGPICMDDDPEWVIKWVLTLDYMNIYIFKGE
jgi:hypothetical protein